MMQLSDYGAELIAGVLTGQVSMPATLYAALTYSAIDPSWDGDDVATYEPADSAYARQSIATSSTGWAAVDGGTTFNALDLTWATPTQAWGLITYVVVCDAATSGNVLYIVPLTNPVSIESGAAVSLPAGTINLSVASLTDQGSDS